MSISGWGKWVVMLVLNNSGWSIYYKKGCISFICHGIGRSCTIWTLLLSIYNPSLLMINPRNSILSQWKEHFDGEVYSLFSLSLLSTSLTCDLCSFRLFKYIRMSSMYTTMQTSSRSTKISFIKCWKAKGAFDKPKGITNYSRDP